ncbi:hypothetical protein MFIFM68171_08548 [Madurella fahalii]|uniref:Rhodopsin domain-containing protein n=1 Tax=Madurella fahalii TaxID=1157608 RepID=A0ABQ0GKN8_9PEZI
MLTTNSTVTLDAGRQHETRAPELIGALTVGPAIATIFVTMRLYTRVVLTRKYFFEDYSIIAALISAVAMSVFMGLTVMYGSGRHIETVSPAELKDLSRHYRVSTLPWEKRLCFSIIVTLTAGYIAILIVEMVRCVPFEAQWNSKYLGAKCINSTAFYFSAQGLNMVMDLVILLGPLIILRHSSALQQKLLFGIALAFGGIACIVSILRFQTLLPSTTSSDPTWDKTPSGFYGVIEANLGIAAHASSPCGRFPAAAVIIIQQQPSHE